LSTKIHSEFLFSPQKSCECKICIPPESTGFPVGVYPYLWGLVAGLRVRLLADETGKRDGILLRPDPWPSSITQVRYQSRVKGSLSTPSGSGKRDFSLEAQGTLIFCSEWRRCRVAARAFCVLHDGSRRQRRKQRSVATMRPLPIFRKVRGEFWWAAVTIICCSIVRTFDSTRPQLDLLQFPLDPLAVAGLLPLRTLADRSERWNADNRTAALLCGLDAVIRQTTVCSLDELTDERAMVKFSCEATGAITGSASEVKCSGTLLLDRRSGLLRSLVAVLEEKRSPGPISPGLDVKGEVQWTQEVLAGEAESAAGLPQDLPESGADSRLLLLTLSTPWRLLLIHDRDWHVFQQTPELMLLRRITNGALIAQCNLSRGPQQEEPIS
jgi:hypothetical protein